jgi:endo-1,4-beta-D-glucanase Y
MILASLSFQSYAINSADLLGMRKNYRHWSGSKPYGDINWSNIGNRDSTQRLIFSESVSYALFSHVLKIKGEDEAETKAYFDQYWNFAKENLVRSSDRKVYAWDCQKVPDIYQTFIPLPSQFQDHLMSWRYVELIENTFEGAIIYQTEDETTHCQTPGIFHDGSQVATDGDLLTAYALLLAYERWHDKTYRDDAKQMIADLRKKAIVHFTAGEIINIEKQSLIENLYKGVFDDTHAQGIFDAFYANKDNLMQWEGINNYVGLWHQPAMDLSDLDEIIIHISGETRGNAGVFVEIEDNNGEPGHIYTTRSSLILNDSITDIHLSKDDFVLYEDYGVQGPIDWSNIKNISIKTKTIPPEYYPYSGSFGTDSIYSAGNFPYTYEWWGQTSFWGFDFIQKIDPSSIAAVKFKISGQGKLKMQLLPEKGMPELYYYLDLSENETETILHLKDFYGNSIDHLKKINFNAIEYFHATLHYLILELNDGTIINIAPEPEINHAKVALQSMHIQLKSGQTHENDGVHFVSNAHGALYMNPSYFMPFAFRKFIEIDSEGADIWAQLLDQTYIDLSKALQLNLHDLNGQTVSGNGHLFPNWFQIDRLTGHFTDVATQKPNNTVRGYIYGYDAFRTLFFLAMDYYLNNDVRDYELLQQVYPFFADELDQSGRIYPTYDMNGSPSTTENGQYTSFGFYAVYLNLFNIMKDQKHVNQLMSMYTDTHRQTDGEFVWTKNELPAYQMGQTEYFMHFWCFFGSYFFDHYYNGPWAFDFGANMSGISSEMRIPVSNNHDFDVKIEKIQTPIPLENFNIVENFCTDQTLSPQETCELKVNYAASECGVNGGQIQVHMTDNTQTFAKTIFLQGESIDWGQPSGTLIGTPNYGYSLAPLYDGLIDINHRTELDEVSSSNGEITSYFGIVFDNPSWVQGMRFYSYPQGYGVNHILEYKIKARPLDSPDQWTDMTDWKSASANGWMETVFEKPVQIIEIRLFYSKVSYYAPKVGEMEFLSRCPSEQTVSLQKGWNMLSFQNISENMDISKLLLPLIASNTLIKVIDEQGASFLNVNGQWVNQIGKAQLKKSYYVKVSQDTTLQIQGTPSFHELMGDMYLKKGWNSIGWPFQTEGDARIMLQSLIDSQKLVKAFDETGSTVIKIGAQWQFGFDSFIPGKGYMIKTTESCLLSPVFLDHSSQSNMKRSNRSLINQTEHFRPVWENNPLQRMNIWIKGLDCASLESGDEIGIYDGNLCVGAGKVNEMPSKTNLLTITCSREDMGNDGFQNGNDIRFRIWDQSEQTEIDSSFVNASFSSISNDQPIDTSTFQILEDYQVLLRVSHSIQTTSGANGEIFPSGNIIVPCASSQLFKITPNAHYHIAQVTVDGQSIGPVTTYEFTNVADMHTIMAAFSNDPPEISSINDQSFSVNTEKIIEFTINDRETSADNLLISVHSSNGSLLPPENCHVSSSGSSRQIRIIPVNDQTGAASIRIIVSDGAGLSTDVSFSISVNYVSQTISLIKGWNLVSTFLQPVDPSFQKNITPLIDNNILTKVIGMDDSILIINGQWHYGLQTIDYRQGYYFHVTENTTLTLTGIPAPLPVTIPLDKGWNLIGYPCMEKQNAQHILATLSDALIKVIDNTKVNAGDINEINYFEQGKGYWIKVNKPIIMTIPVPDQNLQVRRLRSSDLRYPQTRYFKPAWEGNPYERMILWLTDVYGMSLETGDEIGVYDDSVCVGASVISGTFSENNPCKIITSMNDNIYSDQINGFTNLNQIRIKIWKKSENKEYPFYVSVMRNLGDRSLMPDQFKDKEDCYINLVDPLFYTISSLQSLSGMDINVRGIINNEQVDMKSVMFIMMRLMTELDKKGTFGE